MFLDFLGITADLLELRHVNYGQFCIEVNYGQFCIEVK